MKLQTIGHAGMLLCADDGEPLLLTDPWLIGSVYWRSWWLQNYPSEAELDLYSRTRFVYLTHEHPDHFHPPSLRRLGTVPRYLYPELPVDNIGRYLAEHGFAAEKVAPQQWAPLAGGVRVQSIPIWNDDSVLLIDTPGAFVINFNDAKPLPWNIRALARWLDAEVPAGRKRILMSSYSPASSVNSYFRGHERLSLREPRGYIAYINRICTALGADYFMPFASQVIFRRHDSEWANAFKVTFAMLRDGWTSKTRLLPPYSTVDLDTFAVSSIEESAYRSRHSERKIERQHELDATAEVTSADVQAFERKLTSMRLWLAPLYPRGIAIRVRDRTYAFSTWSGRRIDERVARPHFTIEIPAQSFKDAVGFGHFGDLGISMFTFMHLDAHCSPLRVYLFLTLVTLHDYTHIASIRRFAHWLHAVFVFLRWRLPPLGDATTAPRLAAAPAHAHAAD